MSASQGRFLGRGNTAGRPGGRHGYHQRNTGKSSLQQAQSTQNPLVTNNRFSSLTKDTDLMETEVLNLSQAQLEDFKEDLPADISKNKPTGNARMMDISTVEDALDMSVTLNNSTTVTPTSSINPYHRSTCGVNLQTPAQRPNRAEETKEELEIPRRPGGVEETKEEWETLEIPGPPTPTGANWQYFTRLDVILQVSAMGDSATAASRALSDLLQGVFNGTKTKFEIFP